VHRTSTQLDRRPFQQQLQLALVSSKAGEKLSRAEKKKAILAVAPKDRIVEDEESGHIFWPVVRGPYVLHSIVVSKLKILLTGVVGTLGLADLGSVHLAGNASFLSPGYFGALTFSCLTLIGCGELLRKTVGFAYLSGDQSTVRISRVTFFGRRRNFDLPLEDVVPLTDTNETVDKFYWKLLLYPDCESAKKEGKRFFVVGGSSAILNPDKFRVIFGDVPGIPNDDEEEESDDKPSAAGKPDEK